MSVDLGIELLPNLRLDDPFMIASSHWTEGKSNDLLQPLQPSALTLKTTSDVKGCRDFDSPLGGRRNKPALRDWRGEAAFTSYSDGVPESEYWNAVVTKVHLDKYRKDFPKSRIGLSILSGENHADIASNFSPDSYDYVELNWKYRVREERFDTLKEHIAVLRSDWEDFRSAFASKPLLVKIPPEADALLRLQFPDFCQLICDILNSKAGLIVANSRRILVPPSCTPKPSEGELSGGVMMGEHLFLDTYNLLHNVRAVSGHSSPALVATGGVFSIGNVIDTMAKGARAVQLCSVLDAQGVQAIRILRSQLTHICEQLGIKSLVELLDGLKHEMAWKSAALAAEQFRLNPAVRMRTLFQSPDRILKLMEEAISAHSPKGAIPSRNIDKKRVPTGLKLVVTKASIVAFVLGIRCEEQFGMQVLQYPNATRFREALGKSDFEYDLAILPEAAVEYIIKQREHLAEGRTPEIIGTVFDSTFDLVGLAPLTVDKVNRVYVFTGASSQSALGKLIKRNPKIRVERLSELDERKETIPSLMAHWELGDAESAILAKPPLSRLYGELLTTETLQSRWKVLWNTREPISFAAAERTLSGTREDKNKILRGVMAFLQREVGQMLQKPAKGAQRARDAEFVSHLLDLIGRAPD